MSIGLASRRGRHRNENGLIVDVMRHVAIEIAQRQKMEECAGCDGIKISTAKIDDVCIEQFVTTTEDGSFGTCR